MLPQLPYSLQAGLKPALSVKALDYHYNKVHLSYIQKLNQLIEGTQYEAMSLDDIVRATSSVAEEAQLYHYAAEVWNHNFYWQGMVPGGSEPSKRMRELLELHFNGADKFQQTFTQHARAIFGSGWTWLIDNNGHLEIAVTFNGHTMGGGGSTFGSRSEHGVPVVSSSYVRSYQAGIGTTLSGVTPLLALDVWEHAYALDYQMDRKVRPS
jgi:Fe-Mn family superoxide dismutase